MKKGNIGPSRRLRPVIIVSASFALSVFCSSCNRQTGLPEPGSKDYLELVSAFYVGLGALQGGDDIRAQQKLQLATKIAPGEPASWANLGLLSARQQDFETAYQDVDRARSLSPDNSRMEALTGLIESRRGNLSTAIEHLRKAVELDSNNLKALYSLAEETEREAKPTSDAEAERVLAQVIKQRPNNIAVQLEMARLGARTGNSAAMQNAIGKLAQESASWPDLAKQQMSLLQQAAATNPRDAAVRVVFLRNTLARVPEYRNSLNEVKTPTMFVSDPFVRFVKLPSPTSSPAAADLSVRFEAQAVSGGPSTPILWSGAMPLNDQGRSAILWVDNKSIQVLGGARLPYPGAGVTTALQRNAVLGIDFNYDFKTDLIFAGPDGLALYEQKPDGTFADITGRTRLAPAILKGAYTGAWAMDVDLDGDLDIVLGQGTGDPIVLRNNGDETFAVIRPFPGVNGLTSFVAADIDGDGDPDIAMIDGQGTVHVFTNGRLGVFRPRVLPASVRGRFRALAAADVNSDGAMDFVLLRDDGAVIRMSDKDGGSNWDTAQVIKADPGGSPTLIAADFDNNGAIDLLVGDGQIFLGGAGTFTHLQAKPGISSASTVDLNGDGRLDLVGMSGNGQFMGALNHGSKNYHWQDMKLRSAKASGDQRINPFGIGGLVEVRAGLLTQAQSIDSPVLHFGLGDHPQVDVARIIWPNGVPQGEFELKADQEILARQRLKGSCPWLFAWDGRRMSFVKDGSPWSAALGLHINAQVVAGIQQTEEWFKVPGDALKPHDGYYDLRITGELWETYYIDHYSLLVVDHPAGTEIFTDERFSVPPPPLKIYTTTEPHPFASVRDDRRQDVSVVVRDVDRSYLDTFGRGPYQGLTRDHWVELELPADAPRTGGLYLLGTGWTHPTDATVNIAIGQNSIPQPRGLSIETADAQGNWHAVRENLGFPAGKMKTVVLDLTGIFRPGQQRRLRLRTNLEIYWDQLAWAASAPDRNRIQHLGLSSAELRYRGFSLVKAANASSPELPDYDKIASTDQIWRDLEGYATRYGDVRELLEKIDDRIVITNAGDELRLRFRAPEAPMPGWQRDFVMIGDGWIKDGDFNTVYSKTVLPLPWHGMKNYETPPGRLEDDPAWKLHPGDWQTYHTRYVTADRFQTALRN